MGYEIDFLAVGTVSRSGDAILLRWGNLSGRRDEQTVVLVDGGYNDVADQIIEHLDMYYGTSRVDLAVSTHPDADHVNGLRRVIEKVEVGQLWMHLPERHSVTMAALKEAKWTSALHLRTSLREAMSAASDLEDSARLRGIPIVEPFSGAALTANGGGLTVAGPTMDYYEELLPQFTTYTGTSAIREKLAELLDGVGRTFIPESWWDETLTDQGETSPENNSSTILRLEYEGRSLLLTGDAGMPALGHAVDYLEGLAWVPGSLRFIQIPHHGSRRNVGPTVLDRILGRIDEDPGDVLAFVSCAPLGEPKHPHRKVTNAFIRRGSTVAKTAGTGLLHWYDAPQRPGWSQAPTVPFYDQVDDD